MTRRIARPGGKVRWINLFRHTDPIGGPVQIDGVDRQLRDPAPFDNIPGDTTYAPPTPVKVVRAAGPLDWRGRAAPQAASATRWRVAKGRSYGFATRLRRHRARSTWSGRLALRRALRRWGCRLEPNVDRQEPRQHVEQARRHLPSPLGGNRGTGDFVG